jgi:hypothetical protein
MMANMWGLEKDGEIMARYGLHKTRILALGAFWLRQKQAGWNNFTERKCLTALKDRNIKLREYEVKA